MKKTTKPCNSSRTITTARQTDNIPLICTSAGPIHPVHSQPMSLATEAMPETRLHFCHFPAVFLSLPLPRYYRRNLRDGAYALHMHITSLQPAVVDLSSHDNDTETSDSNDDFSPFLFQPACIPPPSSMLIPLDPAGQQMIGQHIFFKWPTVNVLSRLQNRIATPSARSRNRC